MRWDVRVGQAKEVVADFGGEVDLGRLAKVDHDDRR